VQGHIKLSVAVLFFDHGAAMMRFFLTRTELIGQLVPPFLPNLVGWVSTLGVVVVVKELWSLVCGWNEQ
jgi:hypothetical protein